MPRKHANKECFLCERRLLKVEKYGCGSAFSGTQCWWVPAIKEHGLDEAVRISTVWMKANDAAQAMEAEGQDRNGLGSKTDSAVRKADVPQS